MAKDRMPNGKKHATQQSVDSAIWSICDIMRRGNVASALQYVPELTWILFLRILDKTEDREALEAEAVGARYTPSKTPLTLKQFEDYFARLPGREDSARSWTIDLVARKAKAGEDARPRRGTTLAAWQTRQGSSRHTGVGVPAESVPAGTSGNGFHTYRVRPMTTRPPLPALLGGEPVWPQGSPDWPVADEYVASALRRAVADGSWGKYDGGHVRYVEKRLANLHGVQTAVACCSGTFAVELALRALKVGPGAEVVLAAYDFGGNYLNVLAVGATPVLIDVDPENWNFAVGHLPAALTPATKAVIVSHLHGGLAPLREIRVVTEAHGIPVIEDAAQAPGATVQGRPAGGWGDVGVLSFGGSKLLSAGRGGAILTSRADVRARARAAQFRGNVVGPLSELQAAVLVPQLDQLSQRHAKRLRNVAVLVDRLRDVHGLRPFRNRGIDGEPGYYKVGFQYDAATFGLSRERFVEAVRAEGVAVDQGFNALHVGRSPGRFRQAGPLPEAERAHAGAVVLHHPILLGTEADMEQVARAVEKVWAYRDELTV